MDGIHAIVTRSDAGGAGRRAFFGAPASTPCDRCSNGEAASVSRRAGFTLVELLVTVAIVGILAAIAYPTYTAYVERARRAEVQAELMALAQLMERIYTETGCYTPTGGTDCAGLDEELDLSAADSAHDSYDIDFASASDDAFVLQAMPVAGSPQAGDGALGIDQMGQRFWDENDDGVIDDATERDWVRN